MFMPALDTTQSTFGFWMWLLWFAQEKISQKFWMKVLLYQLYFKHESIDYPSSNFKIISVLPFHVPYIYQTISNTIGICWACKKMAKLALVWCNLIRDICLSDIEEASKTLCIQLKLVLSANAAPTFWEKKADTTIQRIQTLEEWNGFKSGFYSSVSMQWGWTPYILSFLKWYSFPSFLFLNFVVAQPPISIF